MTFCLSFSLRTSLSRLSMISSADCTFDWNSFSAIFQAACCYVILLSSKLRKSFNICWIFVSVIFINILLSSGVLGFWGFGVLGVLAQELLLGHSIITVFYQEFFHPQNLSVVDFEFVFHFKPHVLHELTIRL